MPFHGFNTFYMLILINIINYIEKCKLINAQASKRQDMEISDLRRVTGIIRKNRTRNKIVIKGEQARKTSMGS